MTNLAECIQNNGKAEIPDYVLDKHLATYPYSSAAHMIRSGQYLNTSGDLASNLEKHYMYMHDPMQMQFALAGLEHVIRSRKAIERFPDTKKEIPLDTEIQLTGKRHLEIPTISEEVKLTELNTDSEKVVDEEAIPEEGTGMESSIEIEPAIEEKVEAEVPVEKESDKHNDLVANVLDDREMKELSPFVLWLRATPGDHRYECWRDEQHTISSSKKVRKKKKRKKKKKKNPLHQIAKGSLSLNDDIFSETLADLLQSQGHDKRAQYMYEQLRLKYPEKSAYFAAKIDQIKKKKG